MFSWLTIALGVVCSVGLSAHGVSGKDALFLQSVKGTAIGPLMYLGAKHMVTGYDHLAFLVGVIFFLYRLKDIVQYVSLFAIGHSITLLAGVEPILTRPGSQELSLCGWSLDVEGGGGQ